MHGKGAVVKNEIENNCWSGPVSYTHLNNYNAFANECVHDSVRDAILHCLEQEHCIQEDVFNMMHQRGLYPTPDADANKVENAKQKFSQCVKTV